jgi:hypothetical protein
MRALLARDCAERMLDRDVSVADACSRAIEQGILQACARRTRDLTSMLYAAAALLRMGISTIGISKPSHTPARDLIGPIPWALQTLRAI